MTSTEPPEALAAPVAEDLLDRPEAGPVALRGSALRTGGYVAGILLSLASAPLLIRHLGVARFGQYITVLSLVTIVSGVTEGGLNSIVLREYANLPADGRRRLMRSAAGARGLLTLAGVILAVAFAAVAGYDGTLVLGTALAGAGLVLQLFQSLLSVALQSELRFGWASLADLIRQVVNVALLVALVLAGAGIVPLLAAAIPAAAVSLLVTIWLLRDEVSLRPSLHLREWMTLLRESVPWAVISAVNIIYFRVVIVVMSLVASALQTGYFATSFRVVEVLVGVPALVIGAGFPILARAVEGDRARFAYATSRIFELGLIAGTWVVVCLEVAAPFAIHVLAGHKADPSITVLRIQGLALIATFVAVGGGYPLLILRRYREVLAANLTALATAAVLAAALVPSLGAKGGAIAAVVAETGLALATTIFLWRASADVRPRLSGVPVVALAGGAAVAVGVALPVHEVIGTLVASAIYFVVLRLLGRFPREAREVLAGATAGRLRARARG